jgi:hypothetical protein
METLKIHYGKVRGLEGYYNLVYEPITFIDDVSHMRWHWREMSRNTSTPFPTMSIKIVPTTTIMFAFKKVMVACLEIIGNVLSEEEVEELKHLVSDDRLYFYVMTQIVTLLHCFFEYLAFFDDYRFFVGRKTFRGISTSSLLFSAVRSFILFLYLADMDSSKVVLFFVLKDFAFCLYKVCKVYFHQQRNIKSRNETMRNESGDLKVENSTPKTVRTEGEETKEGIEDEDLTAFWDRQCVLHGSFFFLPLFFGFSAYCLTLFKYKSWWSWLVSSLADSFYIWGFLHMLPQIYINYKLKSVAHLPIRAFMYKIFNTFIDDAFAFAVKMPLKHRLMTLRDDLVFVIFLLQWWWYRVDHNRINEYGFRYNKINKALEEETK